SDKLEKQNEALTAEIQALRKELAEASSSAGGPAKATLAERMDVQESRTAELAQAKIETSQRVPVSLTGMVLFNAFRNGRYGGILQDPVTASLTPGAANT